jgi:predicted DNA-binding transcriptional regulator YafY
LLFVGPVHFRNDVVLDGSGSVRGARQDERVNRTERLYALVEELRAVAPRTRSSRWLADRFAVSTRTVERDLAALARSGVPLISTPGHDGGHRLDRAHTLPPLALSAEEAIALVVAVRASAEGPFGAAGRRAAQKVLGVLGPAERAALDAEAERVRFLGDPDPATLSDLHEHIRRRRVLTLRYTDRNGRTGTRDVEPLGLLRGNDHWFLLAWCRLRTAVRGFRLDRIADIAAVDEIAPDRGIDLADAAVIGTRTRPARM